MAALYEPLSNINPTRCDWGIRVRVIRKYEVPNYVNQKEIHAIEFVLQDRDGTRMHASMRKALIQDKCVKLREHETYIMKNFVVVRNNMKYKTTQHEYKLLFMKTTHIAEIEDDTFPTDIFSFKPFGDIIGNPKLDEGELFDLIGQIVGSDEIKTQGTGDNFKKMIDLEIQDLEAKRLGMTLWGECVDMIDDHVKKAGTDPVILILQFGRAKTFMGENRVCNTYYISKVLVNKTIPQMEDFRSRLAIGKETPSQGISQISSPNVYSIEDDLQSAVQEFRKIEDLIEEQDPVKFWLIVTVIQVESEEDWWYLGCKKCSKKLIVQGKHFHCGKCKVNSSTGVPKFKVRVRVVDGSGSVVLLLWDKECVQLLGKTAKELRESIAKDVESRTYPIDIESLVNLKLLCKVEVRIQNILQNDEVYNVVSFTRDPDLIVKYETIFHEQAKKKDKLLLHDGSIGIEFKDSMAENEIDTSGCSQQGNSGGNGVDEELISVETIEGGPSSSMSTNKICKVVKIEK